MTTTATASAATAPTPAPAPACGKTAAGGWIVSRRQDLLWLQGSALAGVALLLLFRALPALPRDAGVTHPALWALLLWGVLFDGTHVMGTYARTYLAPRADTASRRALPGAWSWSVLAIGPLVALADHALFAAAAAPSVMGRGGPLFRGFLLAAYLWAYWHLVRQHYGVLMMYRRQAGEAQAGAGRRLDAAILWAGCLYPYLRFSLGPAYAASGLPVLLPPALAAAARPALDLAAAVLAVAVLAAALVRRVRPAPKHLLLAIVIGFHVAAFAGLDNLLEITATLTIFHNLQYHRIVWRYERERGRAPLGGLGRYLIAGALLGAAWYAPRVLGVAAAGATGAASAGAAELARNALLGLGWGVAFHHYLVDGRIWKRRAA